MNYNKGQNYYSKLEENCIADTLNPSVCYYAIIYYIIATWYFLTKPFEINLKKKTWCYGGLGEEGIRERNMYRFAAS